ncbi:MAG: hypothetical protein GXY40_12960 [Syntrophomonadaceae bacterium]|nr:hypothetical protein [Syntrophomonadaceae bacterium]
MTKILKAGLIALLLCSMFINPVLAPQVLPKQFFLKDVQVNYKETPIQSTSRSRLLPTPLKMIATAYSRSEEEGTADGITKSGTMVRPGVVAVDPEVIPLGTEIFIEGLGVFTAEDTGGAIKGNRLDIYFESRKEALEFGVQSVNVFIKEKKYDS